MYAHHCITVYVSKQTFLSKHFLINNILLMHWASICICTQSVIWFGCGPDVWTLRCVYICINVCKHLVILLGWGNDEHGRTNQVRTYNRLKHTTHYMRTPSVKYYCSKIVGSWLGLHIGEARTYRDRHHTAKGNRFFFKQKSTVMEFQSRSAFRQS